MSEIVLNKEQLDSLSEVFNITFGAAANKLSGIVGTSAKIAKPQLVQCNQDPASEVFSGKTVVIKYSSSSHNGLNWEFFMDSDCASKFSAKLLGKSIDLSDAVLQKEALESINNLMQELMEVALPTCNSTLGTNVILNPGQISYGGIEDKIFDFSKEYPNQAIRVQFLFKVQDVFESKLFLLIGLPFAKEAADSFMQVTSIQTDTLDASKPAVSAREVRETERMQDVLEYCRQIGDFSIIENLNVPIKVKISSRRMRLGDLWYQSTGSVINFKKRVDEPVEILFGNKIMALAEVVTVKEKFGVKITEVKR